MRVRFTKMHGNGNDFVLLDNRAGSLQLTTERLRLLADRHLGVGCDQILVAERPANGAARVAMRVFNADGGAAGQCGNGLRCFAVYARDTGMVTGERFPIETPGGLVDAELLGGGRVRAALGVPRLEPREVPIRARARALRYPLRAAGQDLEVAAVSVGNPHAVLAVEDVDTAPVATLGPAIQALELFPEGVNVGFMQRVSADRVRLRVYERGVGETLACGSGACAAVVAGRVQGTLGDGVTVALRGGDVEVEWPGEGHAVVMSGPTAMAFYGETEL
jgi:diaminopimelate epimerase